MSRLAVLYDIHGNLAALEAVLADAGSAGATGYVLGGDYSTFGPWPRETAERLEAVPAVVRIRGNVERWLGEEPEVPRPIVTAAVAAAREALGAELVRRLYRLPERGELDGILVCHGSPLSDVDSFAPEPEEAAAAYERYAVPETGRIFYEAGFANFRLHPPTEVHFKNADRAPLLIVGAEHDQTVPASLSKAQFKRYERSTAKTDYLELEGRQHLFMIGEGWEEAAAAIETWLVGVLAQVPASR